MAPAHFTRGILAERTQVNVDQVLRRIDVTMVQRADAETHASWFAEPEVDGQYVDCKVVAYRATSDQELLVRVGAVVDSSSPTSALTATWAPIALAGSSTVSACGISSSLAGSG